MMETPIPAQPQKSITGWIIGIVVIVLLCCCCAVVVIATLTLMGPAVGNVFSTINMGIMTPNPDLSFPPPAFDLTESPSALVPEGGNGDQVLRASAWGYVLITAALDGCSYNPKASETQIKVTQEPDSKGVWKEEWTVVCDDGSKKPYDVTFTPSAGGSTDINVTSGH